MALCDSLDSPCLRGKGHTGACQWPDTGPVYLGSNARTEAPDVTEAVTEVESLRRRITELEQERETILERMEQTRREIEDFALPSEQCLECGLYWKTIQGPRTQGKYCSNRCRQRAYRKRRQEF